MFNPNGDQCVDIAVIITDFIYTRSYFERLF